MNAFPPLNFAPAPATNELRESLLNAMASKSVPILPFHDRSYFSPEYIEQIRTAEHFGSFDIRQIQIRDQSESSYSRDHGFMADHGIMEVRQTFPSLIHFERILDHDIIGIMAFMNFGQHWFVNPRMFVANGEVRGVDFSHGRAMTPGRIAMMEEFSLFVANSVQALGDHLRSTKKA